MVKGYITFLVMVMSSSSGGVDLQGNLMVKDYMDVFPTEFPGMSLKCEVGLNIKLKAGTKPISKASYQMTFPKLQKLNIQL